VAKEDKYKGYRGPAKKKLSELRVRVWSDVEATTSKGVFRGIFCPAQKQPTIGTWF